MIGTLTKAPKRRSDILALAKDIRSRYRGWSVDDVAAVEDIYLIRSPGSFNGSDGLALSDDIFSPLYLPSAVEEGRVVRTWGIRKRERVNSIFLNSNATLPEPEVFWHEYYHLHFSPVGVQRAEAIISNYLTLGVVHHQEERRANDFAAAMMIDGVYQDDTIKSIAERCSVSETLAEHGLRLYTAIRR